MGGALVDFLLGAAVIALPQHQVSFSTCNLSLRGSLSKEYCDTGLLQMQVPVAIGSVSIGLVRHLVQKKRKPKRRNGQSRERDEAGQKQVTLEWDSISCTITTKKGGTKEVLRDVSGEAKPGRYVLEHSHSADCPW